MAIKTKRPSIEMGVKATGERVPVRSHGRNYPDLIDENVILAEVKTALGELETSSRLAGSADQRMAHAVMAMYARLAENGSSVDPMFSLATDKSSRDKLMLEIETKFLGPRPAGEKDDAFFALDKKYKNELACLVRGTKLVGIFAKFNVGIDKFNAKLGNWEVPFVSLFDPADQPDYTTSQKERWVMLDQRPCTATGKSKAGKDKPLKVSASVSQLLKLHVPASGTRRPRAGTGTTTEAKAITPINAKDASVEVLEEFFSSAGDAGFEKAMAVFVELFVNNAGADESFANLSPSLQNGWTMLAQHYDVMKANAEKAKAA